MFLIAQTPRAGEGNHCLIVPCRLPISEREVFDRINTAIYESEGKDYIAVSQLVEQTGSVRQGREILVLVGVNVQQLSNTQRAEVRSKLEYYLSQFEVLVTQTIDWQTDKCTLLIYRTELERWRQDKVFSHLPRKRVLYSKQGCLSFLAYFSVFHVHKKWSNVARLRKNEKKRASQTKKPNFYKAGFVILMMFSTISFVSVMEYWKIHEQTRQKPKTQAEIFLNSLSQQGLIDRQDIHKAKEELDDLLCSLPDNPLSQCVQLPFNALPLNNLATRLLKNKGSRDFLTKQLNLEQIQSLETIVKIRNQLRQLDAALANTVPITVYIPLFSEEEVEIAKRLEKQLSQTLPETEKLIHYLNTDKITLTRQVIFKQLLNIWNKAFSNKQLDNAEKELTQLLNQLCNHSLLCEIHKLHRYRQPQSIEDIIETPKGQEQFISEELGLNRLTKMPEPEQIVAIRNALRRLNAQLNDKIPERIFLPIFQQEDMRLITELKEEFELENSEIKLVEGLRKKMNKKPYRFFKITMKHLIKEIDKLK
jgi:hypothetical protein